MCMVSLCCTRISNGNHQTNLNNLKALMNKHAMNRVAFDSFKSHLDDSRLNFFMQVVFIDTFGHTKAFV